MNSIEQANYKNREGLSLADRQKQYENITRHYLIPKQPVIVRINGKAFHSYTKQKGFLKPFDPNILNVFEKTTKTICENIQNVEFGYHQSDEVSLFLKDYKEEKQQQYFNGNIQKISSTIVSEFTYYFNKYMLDDKSFEHYKPGIFDCSCFNLPLHEVSNYFIWRQRDAIKNSISMYASMYFSNNELMNKNSSDKLEMLKSIATLHDWSDLSVSIQRGTSYYKIEVEEYVKNLPDEIINFLSKKSKGLPETFTRNKWLVDYNTPIFSENKDFIEKYI